jgi:hypothetical protein
MNYFLYNVTFVKKFYSNYFLFYTKNISEGYTASSCRECSTINAGKWHFWTTNLSQHQTGNSWTSQSNTVKWFIETLQTVHLYSELISLSYKMAFITINVNLESSHHEYFSRLISKFLTLLLRILWVSLEPESVSEEHIMLRLFASGFQALYYHIKITDVQWNCNEGV